MLSLTCSVTAKHRQNGRRQYLLEPVASHSIVPGVANPPGIDNERTHVAIYDREGGKTSLLMNDLNPDDYENGGCLIVLGTLGWLHLIVFLDSVDSEAIIPDLDASLVQNGLHISLSTDGVFDPAERVAIEQWLAGERHREDLRLSAKAIPTFGLVRQK